MNRAALIACVLVGAVSGVAIFAVACHRDPDAVPPPASSVATLEDGPVFHVDAQPDGACAHDKQCALRIHLVAGSNYHLSPDYPFKFVPAPSTFVDVAPREAFVRDSEKTGALPVHFQPKSAGNVLVAGIFKLAVCNDKNCRIEEAPVAVNIVAE